MYSEEHNSAPKLLELYNILCYVRKSPFVAFVVLLLLKKNFREMFFPLGDQEVWALSPQEPDSRSQEYT